MCIAYIQPQSRVIAIVVNNYRVVRDHVLNIKHQLETIASNPKPWLHAEINKTGG